MPTTREKLLTQSLWFDGPQSRSQLHERLGIPPNGVGDLARSLLKQRVLLEVPTAVSTPGRPRLPMDFDDRYRDVVGIALSPGRVGSVRLNLRGVPIAPPVLKLVGKDDRPLSTATSLLRSTVGPRTLAVGISITGFVDLPRRQVLLSSSFQGQGNADLSPLLAAAGTVPVLLDNDMHAVAAHWMLENRSTPDRDVLLVGVADGRIGAATLIGGRPTAGCVVGANELGHMRLGIESDRCYCGQTGCSERLFSSSQLQRLDPQSVPLNARAAAYADNDPALETVVGYLGSSIANAVNFVRPHHLVLAGGDLLRHEAFTKLLLGDIRSKLLTALLDRVQLDVWDRLFDRDFAVSAGWLALAGALCRDWTAVGPSLKAETA